MANELNCALGVTGMTGATALTAQLYTGGSSSGSPIAMTEIDTSGLYTGTMAGSAGTYDVLFLSGAVVLASGTIIWDGSAEVSANAANVTKVNGTAQTARDIGATLGVAGAGLTALGDTRIANLDASITDLASHGDSTWATAMGFSTHSAADVWAVATRSLTTFGTLVSDIATAVWGATTRVLTAGTNIVLAKGTGVTGFNDIAATAIVSSGAITTSGGAVSNVTLADTVTTYTGNTPQTGDSFLRIGAAGAGLTALGDARLTQLYCYSTDFNIVDVATGGDVVYINGGSIYTAGNAATPERIIAINGLLRETITGTNSWISGPGEVSDDVLGLFTTVAPYVDAMGIALLVPGLSPEPAVYLGDGTPGWGTLNHIYYWTGQTDESGDLPLAGSLVEVAITLGGPPVAVPILPRIFDVVAQANQLIGAAGVSLTSLGDTRIANLDAAISTRTKPADTQARVALVDVTTTNSDMRGTDGAYTGTPPTVGAIADQVWDEAIGGHAVAGSTGAALSSVMELDIGTGPIAQVYSLTVSGSPCADALVIMSTDSAGATPIHRATTNALGQCTFYPDLPVGTTVYLWRFKTGVDFQNPDSEQVHA